MQLAPSLHRLGDRRVGVYLVEEAGSVTVIDAGVPGYFDELSTELAAMGRTLDDIDALVLTHGHSDHIGFAERLRLDNEKIIDLTHQSNRAASDENAAPAPTTDDSIDTQLHALRAEISALEASFNESQQQTPPTS